MTTTASKLLQTVADFRRRLLANEAQAAQAMETAHANTLKIIEVELTKLYDAMTEAIASGQPFSLSKLYEANRLETIKRLISGEIDQFGALARTMTGRLQEDGVHLGLDAALQLLQIQVPLGIAWSFGTPSMEALAQLIGATQTGSPLATLFAGFGAEAADKASKALVTGVTLGWNPRRIAPLIQEKLDISRARALTISRTESLRAYRNASLETYRANSDVVTKYRRTCAKNGRTCAACIALDGKLYDLDTAFAIHPNCFPAGTIVSGPRVVGSTKRLYTGDLIEVETSFGNFLSVTPNHPILTPNGWIKAGELMEGDHVFSAINRERPFTGIDPNEYQIPSLIEEVVESFTSPGNMTTIGMPTTAKDFHGDGTDSQVCIIRANSQLRSRLQPQFLQPLRDLHFNRGHIVGPFLFCACSPAQFLKRTFGPSDGIVGWLGLPAPLFRSLLCCLDSIGLAHGSQIHAKSFQSHTNYCTGSTEGTGKGIFGFPIEIALRQFFVGYWKLYLSFRDPLCGSLRPPLSALIPNGKCSALCRISDGNTTFLQPFSEGNLSDMIFFSQGRESFTGLISADSGIKPIGGRLGNTLSDLSNGSSIGNNNIFEGTSIGMEDTGKLIHGLAGSVQCDQIIRIRKRTFHGYVYNLQTVLGWYSANGIITHNCRCTTVPITKSWDEILGPLGIDTSNIPDTRPQIETGAAWLDRQDEAIQRKILGAKYQGWKDGKFTLEDVVKRTHSDDWGDGIQEKSLKELMSK